jgi:hypothetical protein
MITQLAVCLNCGEFLEYLGNQQFVRRNLLPVVCFLYAAQLIRRQTTLSGKFYSVSLATVDGDWRRSALSNVVKTTEPRWGPFCL